MTEDIKQRNESKAFLKDLQYYLFQNKRSPNIDALAFLLDNDEKQIVELEKENAELKELQKKKEEIEIMTNFCKACKKMHTDNLTRAKEIIKELLDTQSQLDPYRDIFKDRTLKAEQFLKESE